MNNSKNKGTPNSDQQILNKLQRFCAYQDRSIFEVKEKLQSLKLPQTQIKKIIKALLNEDYLNDERYARSFARGKFRIKKWGRRKIQFALKYKNINDQTIKIALEEIEEQEYDRTLNELIIHKWPLIKGKNKAEVKAKLLKYLISKGYEEEKVWAMLLQTKERFFTAPGSSREIIR